MNLFDKFAAGLPLAEFLAKYGTDADRAKWQRATDQTQLTDAQKTLLRKFTRRTNVLVLVHDLDVRVAHATTGELIRKLTIDPTKDYQPLGRPPGPKPRQPR